jgi:peptide deformylase
MILPIHTYGAEVLRAPTASVEHDSVDLQTLIDDMFETMDGASGIGLAAPQVGHSLRLFVVDLSPLRDDLLADGEIVPEGALVFINPRIVSESGDIVAFEEGCLSIPDLRDEVDRPSRIHIEYQDRELNRMELVADGMTARVIQHEYDHLEGILFTDRLSAFRRKLLRRRLREIAEGNVEADYLLAE